MALRNNNGQKIIVTETITNTSVNVISITEDKLVNILNRHVAKIKKNNDWMASLALLLSLIAMAITTDFHETFGMSSDTLRGLFYAGVIASFIHFVRSCYNCYKNRDSVDDIVKDIKDEI